MTRELVTIQQAMARVGVSRRSIYNWLTRGRIEYVRTAGGCVRIYADTLTTPGVPRPRPVPLRPPVLGVAGDDLDLGDVFHAEHE